jgi:Uma2 family endonuclease
MVEMMSTITRPNLPVLPRPPSAVWRFTVDQYHRMIGAGILGEDDPVELINGWIVPKMARNPPHDSTVTRLQRSFWALLGPEWVIRTQCAVTLDDSEPEPDITVALGPDGRYDDHHPGSGEIALVVEVADSSLVHDRDEKAPAYAAAQLPLYWIVNLPERQVEVYDQPSAGVAVYGRRRDYHIDDDVPLIVFGRQVGLIAVREILPP